MPSDYARIVAFLADAGQFVYSRKALAATKAGRSAWVLRLFVILLSSASFANNVRDAWPNVTDISLYSLAPAIWISTHEFMLHGKRRAIKEQLRAEKIRKGLIPAPVAKLGFTPVLLAPWPMFLVKRLMLLTGCSPVEAAQLLIRRAEVPRTTRRGKTKTSGRVYFAWVALLQRAGLGSAVTIEREAPLPTPPAPKAPLPAAATPALMPAIPKPMSFRKAPVIKPVAATPAPTTTQAPVAPVAAPAPAHLAAVGLDGSTPLAKLPKVLREQLLAAVPPRTGERSAVEHAALCVTIEQICEQHGATYTGRLAAQLLGVSGSRISRFAKEIAAIKAEQAAKALAPTGS
jgi:hypothetical protein